VCLDTLNKFFASADNILDFLFDILTYIRFNRYTEQGNPVASPVEGDVLYSGRVCIVITQTRYGFTANGYQTGPPEFDVALDDSYDYGFTESGHPVDTPVSDVLGDLGFGGDPAD